MLLQTGGCSIKLPPPCAKLQASFLCDTACFRITRSNLVNCQCQTKGAWFQVENGVTETIHARADGEMLDERVGTEADNEDNVSEISGLSDVSIAGAGRWHPMKGLLSCLSVFCIF